MMGPSVYNMLPHFDEILKEKKQFELQKEGRARPEFDDTMD